MDARIWQRRNSNPGSLRQTYTSATTIEQQGDVTSTEDTSNRQQEPPPRTLTNGTYDTPLRRTAQQRFSKIVDGSDDTPLWTYMDDDDVPATHLRDVHG